RLFPFGPLCSARKASVASFTQRHGTELAFHTESCRKQEADLGDYITFMMNFRGVLTRLKPSR
ncbi:hypothetical protein TNCV_3275381, partial [Trichonephila clavipes]